MPKPRIDGRKIQRLGIVQATQPLAELSGSGRLRALERHDQVFIAADTSTVLRRTRAGPAQTDRENEILWERDNSLHREVVLPIVPEVVGVLKPAVLGEVELVEIERPRIGYGRVPIVGLRILVARAADFKLIEVVVLPGHHGLENTMKIMERDTAGNRDASPDRRLDLGQLHVQ
jgi:hypothetical protein